MSTQNGPPQGQAVQHGPPYPPSTAGLGGQPTISVDVPISSVLIFIYVLGAAFHMTIFQINRRRGHKFVISGVCFGFCMARITANIMRIVWACRPRNVNIAIAANVIANAGVVLLFVINLIFTKRLLRAYHPKLGWSKAGTWLFRALFACIGLALVLLIIAITWSFFILDESLKGRLRDIALFGSTFLTVLAFLPIPILIFVLVLPGRAQPVDRFGAGSMKTKFLVVMFTAALLTLGASLRTTASYLYGLIRIDKRFHVPDGADRYGHYRNGVPHKYETTQAATVAEKGNL